MAPVPTITLNNGVEIPQLGFGVYQVPPEDTADVVATALELGYRHIDTAQMYGNEREVGQGIRDSGVPREEVFVTSKLNNAFHARDAALEAFDGTLGALGFDYLDLFLIHWPLPGIDVDYVETWKAMEENYALFDFALDEEDMVDLTALDRGERTGPDPDTFAYVPAA